MDDLLGLRVVVVLHLELANVELGNFVLAVEVLHQIVFADTAERLLFS